MGRSSGDEMAGTESAAGKPDAPAVPGGMRRNVANPGPDEPSQPAFRASLYSSTRAVRSLGLEELAGLAITEQDLLWIDLCGADPDLLDAVLAATAFPAPIVDFVRSDSDVPTLLNLGACFGVRVLAASLDDALRFRVTPMSVLCGTNIVVSVTRETIPHLTELHAQQQHNNELGSLGAESFTTSLLDGQLATYYHAMSQLEAEVERLEIEILSRRKADCLDLLRTLRKASSRLRRVLASHRSVFGGLARPDFRPNQERIVDKHFEALESRYERAMDLAEHGRDLVVGTFELFTTRATMSTNETIQVLTFATVLIGALAVFAGVLGMNFEVGFFDSGAAGFWTAVGAMGIVSIASVWLARRRGWLP
jgi:magnesium transporter